MTEPVVPVPSVFPRKRLDWLVDRIRLTGRPDLPLLTVSASEGISPRGASANDGLRAAAEDLSSYLVVRPNDIVVNPLVARDGALGRSEYEGIVSPAYFVLRARESVEARFLDYALHAAPYLAEIGRRSKWMPPNQFDISWDLFRSVWIHIPDFARQVQIADFLDADWMQGALVASLAGTPEAYSPRPGADPRSRATARLRMAGPADHTQAAAISNSPIARFGRLARNREALILERRQALITAAVTGQLDVRAEA